MNESTSQSSSRIGDAEVRFVPRTLVNHHLGSHSGYERVFEFMGLPAASSRWAVRLVGLIPRELAWRLWLLRPQRTQQVGLLAELGAAPWIAMGRKRLCHFIYGEDTFMFTPLWKGGANKCIATFHYPPGLIVERLNPGPLAALDAVIMVGENQREYFERFLPAERVHYCPHAVDTDFFSPPGTAERAGEGRPRLICVGQMFRNYDMLAEVHRALLAQGLDFETHIVGPERLRESAVVRLPGVFLHSGISDEALRDLYRGAAIGVLPLDDSTANNALLEMMASGLPVVCSRVGGVGAYVAGSAVNLADAGDSGAIALIAAELLRDPARRRREGDANRAHCERELSLSVVGGRLREIYGRVLAG